MYLGDLRLGDTLDFTFTTRRFTTGAPFTLAGSPTIAAYVDDSTTEITAGITLSADFDSRTGLNHVRVVATSGNGFATATNVHLVITAGTVDSVSVVGEVIGTFSIEARSALRSTVAGRPLDVSTGGEAGIDWANIGSPTTAQTLSGTTIDPDQVVASVVGAVGSVTGLTPATVHADLDDLQSRLPAALVGGRMDSVVGAMGAGVLTAAALAADAIDAILDDPIGDSTLTLRQALRVLVAGMAGKLSGAATATITIRNVADSADVIVASVDASGNRSAVVVTP